ncbi:uncharacterized protein LOC131022643 [Salvia miltiorrhiza]|uniref:uncharacterized protein LOC131022643 n=1 Tax=Salvia miltiorrhiza TaxID=226208 RepID=UPI0025ABB84F|nr:uncharacterized protein LOC131022643 [Salvia miltiorrhiza]
MGDRALGTPVLEPTLQSILRALGWTPPGRCRILLGWLPLFSASPPGKGKDMEVLGLFSPDSQRAGGSGSGSGSGQVEGGSAIFAGIIPVVDISEDATAPEEVQDIPTPAFTRKMKGAVLALAEKRRKESLQKGSRLVDPEGEPTGEAEATSMDAEGGKTLALTAGASEASGSKPVSSMKGREFVRKLLIQIHPKDRDATKKMKRARLASSLGQLWIQLESQVGEAIQCIDDYDVLEKDLQKEREAQAKRHEEVTGMVERFSHAEADAAALQARVDQLEVEKASLASELERAKKEGYGNLVRFRMQYQEEYKESKRRWKVVCKDALSRG